MIDAMRYPRRATALQLTKDSWWYINPGSIDIFEDIPGVGVSQIRLKRSQLEQAIAIMDQTREKQE